MFDIHSLTAPESFDGFRCDTRQKRVSSIHFAMRSQVNLMTVRILILVAVMVGIGPAYAQQSPDQPKTSTVPSATTAPAAAPATNAKPASPSTALLRQARLAGFHTRKLRQGGTTVFCKEEAHLGSRFSSESCIDEKQLEEFLIRAEDQRDKLMNRRGTGTDYH